MQSGIGEPSAKDLEKLANLPTHLLLCDEMARHEEVGQVLLGHPASNITKR